VFYLLNQELSYLESPYSSSLFKRWIFCSPLPCHAFPLTSFTQLVNLKCLSSLYLQTICLTWVSHTHVWFTTCVVTGNSCQYYSSSSWPKLNHCFGCSELVSSKAQYLSKKVGVTLDISASLLCKFDYVLSSSKTQPLPSTMNTTLPELGLSSLVEKLRKQNCPTCLWQYLTLHIAAITDIWGVNVPCHLTFVASYYS
jgi:hypothetical protein